MEFNAILVVSELSGVEFQDTQLVSKELLERVVRGGRGNHSPRNWNWELDTFIH